MTGTSRLSPAATALKDDSSRMAQHASTSWKILIVDDSTTDRDFLVTTLGYAGHQLIEACGGEEALAVARSEHPDLIIADILMPAMDGYEFVQQLRGDPAIAQTPVIFCSATYGEHEARPLAEACGVSFILQKPAGPDEVFAVVRQALGLSETSFPSPPEDFDQQHLRLVTNKLSEKSEEERRATVALEERACLASLTADVGLALTRSATLGSEMLQLCADAIVGHLDAAFARIWTLNKVDDMLELQASAGLYTHLDGLHGRIRVGEFKIGLIAQERRPHLTNAVVGDPQVSDQEWARREGMVSFAGYPMLVEDRLIGVVAMFSRRPLTETAVDALGSIADMLAVGVDRLRSENALRAREEQFRQLAENISEVFWITNANLSEMFYVSPAYEKVWGRSCQSLYKQPMAFLDTICPEDRPATLSLIQEHMGRDEFSHEFRILQPQGTIRWIWNRAFPVRDEHGQIYRMCGIAQDVTDRKKLEEQLRQAQKMEAIGNLAGGIAHDFNNLMTVVTGYSQLVLNRVDEESPLRADVEEIKKAGQRAASLTRQLLAFGRRQVLSPELLSLGDVVSNIKEMLKRLIGENIELVVTRGSNLSLVKADPGQIEQLIMNLVLNARDAMPVGGKLLIETANVDLDDVYCSHGSDLRPGPHVMLTVSDTGIGMDAETQSHIFEPFFTTKEPGKGTGLGLSMVYGIVQQSGGSIRVYSEPGNGATFRILLPQANEHAALSEAEESHDRPQPGFETILLAEDEEMVRTLTRRILESHSYKILEARDGSEALAIAEQHIGPVHLLLTDVIMPKMCGKELAQQLQKNRPDIRVLYMSGYSELLVSHQGILDANVALIEKPFSEEGLLQRIRTVLDDGPSTGSTVAHFGCVGAEGAHS
jgi:PAS domain S-box-containing protein